MAGNALQKPVNLSSALENVIGRGPMTRAQVTSKEWDYIKANGDKGGGGKGGGKGGKKGKKGGQEKEEVHEETDELCNTLKILGLSEEYPEIAIAEAVKEVGTEY